MKRKVIAAAGLITLGWAIGKAQSRQPDFELNVNAPAGDQALAHGAGRLLTATPLAAQTIPAAAVDDSIRGGARETPFLAEVLGLSPGMSVADIGAGFGGWTLAMARLLGPKGAVYATDIGVPQLAILRDLVVREGLSNVAVIEGAAERTNLPDNCCDAVFMRNVYHHLPRPEPMIDSAFAALKPGGRLAIIDFVARPGSALPPGVRENRGGNGIPPAIVIDEMKATAFNYIKTISPWPPDGTPPSLFVVLFEKPVP